ncbi:MAG: PD-(D/E)XK nuclease family protein, partial [bacterium]
KTDLLPISRADVDRLENYVLAYGIKGRTWTRTAPWDFHTGFGRKEDWDDIDLLRRQVASWLMPLFSACEQPLLTGASLSLALWSFFEEMQVGSKLMEWAQEASASGDLELAQEHTQVWTGFLELLDELVVGLGDTVLTAIEYAEILASGLEGLRLGLVPPSLDQVLVGSLERSRHPNVRAAFVLGVSEGVLPGRASEDAVLNDREREQLLAAGIELAPTSRANQFHERYLMYIALTRASERLWISFPLADAEGKALAPSRLIARLRELFPGLQEEYAAAEPSGNPADDIKFLTAPKQALQHLASQLRLAKVGHQVGPVWVALQQYLWSRPEMAALITQATSGLRYNNQEQPLSRKLARSLYGRHNRASATRLERFAACPFQHFTYHGLNLRAREVFGVDLPSLGRFTHAVLSRVTKRLLVTERSFGDLLPEEAANMVGLEVEDMALEFAGGILQTSPRYVYLTRRLQRLLLAAVQVLSEQGRCGDFRPHYTEVKFGLPGGAWPALQFHLADGSQFTLAGQIDRIDFAQQDDQMYFVIVDYKSRSKKLSLPEVYFGLSLQLLLYLLAAAEGLSRLGKGQVLPAGIFYFAVQEGFVKSTGPLSPNEAAQAYLKQFRLEGLVYGEEEVVRLLDRQGGGTVMAPILNKDGSIRKGSPACSKEQFNLLLNFAAQKVKEIGSQVMQGDVQIAPYRLSGSSACDYCDFSAVCQFDPLLPDNDYRVLPKLTTEETWSALQLAVKGDGGHE